ncbi:MAG TPA: hypothetical protein VFP50_20625, partial [Anaeromyxobacteraceae bacterium]|nr:hypothetical protein [Anaeromyxobacteraceae bacterium]
VLGEHAGEPLEALCRRCHQALRRTRGAALALAAFDRGALAWLAVGSVQGSLAIAATPGAWHGLVQAAGLVGLKLPPLRVRRWPLAPGDTLVIATDGARAALDAPPSPAEPPQRTADQLLARTFTGEDDALVLVARCRGVIP